MHRLARRAHSLLATSAVLVLSSSLVAAPPTSPTPTHSPSVPSPQPPSPSSAPAPSSAPTTAPAPTSPPTTAPTSAPAPDSAPIPPPAAAPPAPPAPAPQSAPAPAPPLVPAPPPAAFRLDTALVHLAVDYPGAVLELRNYVDAGTWQVACAAPCDKTLVTLGAEARVSAPGMTTSNVFRIDPGPGIALVKVSGGSDKLRTLGILGLAGGIPIGLAGTAMYGYGKQEDRDGLVLAGGIVLGTGAALILAAIPMLISSTTNVRDAKGSAVARATDAGETN